jgi:hypothetical protein
MDNIQIKREALYKAYPGAAWREKVKAMSEDQVVAVYLRLRNQNKI